MEVLLFWTRYNMYYAVIDNSEVRDAGLKLLDALIHSQKAIDGVIATEDDIPDFAIDRTEDPFDLGL